MDNTSNNLISVFDLVIGTTEDVSDRREVALILEELSYIRGLPQLVSGSFAEGVYSRDSDIDLMYEELDLIACSLSDILPTGRYICFYMIPSPENHSYCMLLCQDKDSAGNDCIEIYEGNYYLSSGKIKYNKCRESINSVIHGPCVQYIYGDSEVEQATCIRCFSWPEIANEWLSRPRQYGWPGISLIRKITLRSCHVVPIGVPNSATNSLEWRVSFSLAERALVHSFNRTQFVVYCILKRITNDIIGKEFPNVLCSYFIKTILFYSIESTSATMWKMQNLQECVHKCIRVLYGYVDDLYCPHYFIRDVNLFKFKVNYQNQCMLLALLRRLLSMTLEHILSCMEMFAPYINTSKKSVISFGIEISSYVKQETNILFFLSSKPEEHIPEHTEKMLSKRIKELYRFYALSSNIANHVRTSLYLSLADALYNSHASNRNRTHYHFKRLTERFYRLGTLLDVASGRLQLANFYLMNGNANRCLNVIQSVLNRFSPCVRVMGADIRPSYCSDYGKFIFGKGLSAQQKFHLYFAFSPMYCYDNVTVPLAIRYLICDNTESDRHPGLVHISPLIHAYFLQAMCYLEQCNHSKLEVTIKMIKETLKDDSLINRLTRHNDYNILGYILMQQGNINDAVQYHVKAFYSKDEHKRRFLTVYRCNIAILRIMSCLRYRLYPV